MENTSLQSSLHIILPRHSDFTKKVCSSCDE